MTQARPRHRFAALPGQLRAASQLWRRSLALVFAAAPQQTAALGMLMLLQAALPVGTLWASRGVVNAAVRTFSGAPATAGLELSFAGWIAIAVGVIVVQQFLAPLSQAAQEAVGDRLTAHLNGELIAAVNRWRGLARFEDPTFANHLATARERAVTGPFNVLYYGEHLLGRLFTIVAMSAALWRLHPLAPLLVILASLPQALQQYRADARMAGRIYRQSEEGRKLQVYRDAVLGEGPAKDVRLFDLRAFFLRQYDPIFACMLAEIQGMSGRLLRRLLPAVLLSGTVTAAVYLYAVRRVLDGGFTLGDLVLFSGALLQVEAALLAAGWSVGLFTQFFVWLPSLFLVLDAGPDLPQSSHPVFSSSPYLPTPPSPFRTLWPSLRLIWEAAPLHATVLLLTTLLMSGLPLALAWLSKLILDRLNVVVVLHQRTPATVDAAFSAAALYAGLQFVSRLLDPSQRQMDGALGIRLQGMVDRRTMAAGGAIPDLDQFERKEFHDEIAFLQGEISHRPAGLIRYLPLMGRNLLTAIGLAALLAHVSPLLPVVLVVCTIPQIVVQDRLEELGYEKITSRSEAARMMTYCASVTTTAGTAKELLVFGLGPWFRDRWRRLSAAALLETAHLRRVRLFATVGVVLGYGAGLALIYAGVAAGLGSRRLTVGDFALYLSAATALQQALAGLSGGATLTGIALRLMARWFAFLHETRPSIVVAPPGTGLIPPWRFRQGLELRDVTFAYPGALEPILRGITCTLRAGEAVALVGENGAGKTTLVKLLTRLYDPSSGAILLDGLPLADYDLATLRRRSTVLFQDFAHFALSAQHNIGVGDADAADDRERVLAAAARTGADAVLRKLPNGLGTPLSRAFTGGTDLSGGEWQKVAMARAAMRDAALVILDEPTAALDAQAEYDLFQRFRELAADRTVLLISHRFSTVRMADRILVLEGGRIVEDGSHEELLALGRRYATLFEMQAGRYR